MSGWAKNGVMYPCGTSPDMLTKNDIATVVNENSTNKQVVGAKDFYNHTSTRNIKTYTEFYQIGLERLTCSILDVINALPSYSLFEAVIDPSGVAVIAQECPYIHGTLMINKAYPDRVKLYYFPNSDVIEGQLYFCEYHPNTGLSEWSRVCTTSVPDMSGTIPIPNDITCDGDTRITYNIIDGVCYIYMWLREFKSPSGVATISGFPKSKIHITGDFVAENTKINGIYSFGLDNITLYRVPVDTGDSISISFSYPVDNNWRP